MNITIVAGARPNFMKIAPIIEAIKEKKKCGFDINFRLVHTGQHYDQNMSDIFFEELAIPAPDVNLGIGSGTHAGQTAAMLKGLEEVMLDQRPDVVVAYGDTNSTIAAALAAVKQHLPVAHVEAGLRSFNRRMPEEHNRVLTDHCADLLLAPTAVAMGHLKQEGLAGRSRLVGDVMLDIFEAVRSKVGAHPLGQLLGHDEPYVLATIHRQENTDDVDRLAAIISALASLPLKVVLAAHPRLRNIAGSAGISLDSGSIVTCEPLGYSDLVATLAGATAVVTDSGGLQKEAFFAGTPCTTVRTETEWVETLVGDWNALAQPEEIASTVLRDAPATQRGTPYGDGKAGHKVVEAIETEFSIPL
jgi:UDP-N-acetylglucosamine 2-epimerase (non-hydrolysing)